MQHCKINYILQFKKKEKESKFGLLFRLLFHSRGRGGGVGRGIPGVVSGPPFGFPTCP